MGGMDTDCGKTVSCCALSKHFARQNHTVKYLKPFQTGPESDWDGLTIQKWGQVTQPSSPYFWTHFHPGAPYECTTFFQGHHIQWSKLNQWIQTEAFQAQEDIVLIEGCGGIHVPITSSQTLCDLLQTNPSIETLLVSHLKLGTLNHTSQGLQTLQHLPNPFLGVIYFGDGNPRNITMIESLYKAPTLGRVWLKYDDVCFEGQL
jgi:dethiobiotin synthetase